MSRLSLDKTIPLWHKRIFCWNMILSMKHQRITQVIQSQERCDLFMVGFDRELTRLAPAGVQQVDRLAAAMIAAAAARRCFFSGNRLKFMYKEVKMFAESNNRAEFEIQTTNYQLPATSRTPSAKDARWFTDVLSMFGAAASVHPTDLVVL